MASGIRWYVFKGDSLSRFDPAQCAASVPNDYGVRFHQCTRKPRWHVGGYYFCTQHAKIVAAHTEFEMTEMK